VLVGRRREDDDPGLCYQSPRLLQRAVLYGITDELTRCLQSVQNAAARLVTGTRRCDHISPVLRQLHWLPVPQRVMLKIATLVHRSLSGQSGNAPGYVADDCPLVADARVRQLRSADTRTLVSRSRSSFGDRTFAAAGPLVWNSLPPNLTDYVGCHTASSGRYLRHYYSDSEPTAQCELRLTAQNRNILTYLLTYLLRLILLIDRS